METISSRSPLLVDPDLNVQLEVLFSSRALSELTLGATWLVSGEREFQAAINRLRTDGTLDLGRIRRYAAAESTDGFTEKLIINGQSEADLDDDTVAQIRSLIPPGKLLEARTTAAVDIGAKLREGFGLLSQRVAGLGPSSSPARTAPRKAATPHRSKGGLRNAVLNSFVKPVCQPNGYSCGSTSAWIVARAIHGAGKLRFDPESLIKVCGTNPETGTTHLEMAQALNALQLQFRRGVSRNGIGALDDLARAISNQNLVLLRTRSQSSPTGGLHWVVVSGYTDLHRGVEAAKFQIADPGGGVSTEWSGARLLEAWKTRDYDCFVVPVSQPRPSFIWERPLAEYLRTTSIVKNEDWTPMHHDMIAGTQRSLMALSPPDPVDRLLYRTEELDFFRYRNRGIALLAVRRDDGVRVGGIAGGSRLVLEEFRGRGYGAAIAAAAAIDCHWQHLFPSSYSEAGMASRIRSYHVAREFATIIGLSSGLDLKQQVRALQVYEEPALAGP